MGHGTGLDELGRVLHDGVVGVVLEPAELGDAGEKGAHLGHDPGFHGGALGKDGVEEERSELELHVLGRGLLSHECQEARRDHHVSVGRGGALEDRLALGNVIQRLAEHLQRALSLFTYSWICGHQNRRSYRAAQSEENTAASLSQSLVWT